jgi:enoyl-CoA hydratase
MKDNPFAPAVLIESHDAVRLVKLNRPETLNAVSEEIHRGLAGVWRHIAADPDARAIVLTGEGRAFSAGGDMENFVHLWTATEDRRRQIGDARTVVLEMVECPLPMIAAVNGPAVGLGASVAVLCDIVLMSERAFFADPHVGVGLTAGDGGAATWPLLMSMLKAKEYLFTGDRISPPDAVTLGLANRVVAPDQLLDEAMALAQRLAGMPPQALQTTKRALNMHVSRAITGVLEYALAAEYHSFDTPEHQAIVKAFLEKSKSRT